MAYLEAAREQTEQITRIYEDEHAVWGYIPNFARTYSLKPEVYQAWKSLNGAIKATMDLRRYEVATLAAASALRSSYCALAHGRILADKFMAPEQVAALAGPAPETAADLTPEDRAVAAFARKVVQHADRVDEADVADVAALRAHGLSDDEVSASSSPRLRVASSPRPSTPPEPRRTCSFWASRRRCGRR